MTVGIEVMVGIACYVLVSLPLAVIIGRLLRDGHREREWTPYPTAATAPVPSRSSLHT